VQSLICIPIIYKNESLGVLGVDNIKSQRPLNTSDINLLMGVASQTAVGIMNAVAFRKIQESEKKYRELVENANSIIMRINIKGQITFFNEYAQRVFGYTETEVRKKKNTDIFGNGSGGKGSFFDNLIEDLKQHPEITVFNESKGKLSNGEDVWIAWTYRPIFSSGNTFKEILCVGNEITDLKRAEQEKADLEFRLHRAQKMEAIGTLAGGVAHDLNNILSGIVSYPDLMLIGLPQDSPLRKSIRIIQKSGNKAAAIVQDLLTLARRGVVTKEVVNLNAIVREYLSSPEFEHIQQPNPGIAVKTSLPEDVLNVVGSPVHLSKSIMNLVKNAMEAISDLGEVTISTENTYVDTSINGYDQVKNGDYVTLSVADTGSGISSQDQEHIFEPFYTKKVMGESGTGLGMAVVWGTVKDHHGYIDLKSTPGKGTCFTLYFPAVRQSIAETRSIVSSIHEFMGKGESILVVDDAEEQRDIATEMLKLLRYTVHSVSSGAEAVAYMQAGHSPDLLVLDMIMQPGMDGLDTYREILRQKPGQRAIITSGFAETERVKEAIRLGAKTYIKKPYLIETIGKAVWTELNSE
jgi:PAS domain S-box-containing protein